MDFRWVDRVSYYLHDLDLLNDGIMALEIERKFLVLADSYKREAFSSYHIQQGYICKARGKTVRVRIRDQQGFITIKGPSDQGGIVRYEFEQEIPLADARELMKLCEPGVIDKTRWLVNADEHTFEVDEFHGEHEGLVVAEVELNNPNETTKIPHFIGKEVTGIRCYYNSQLHTFDYRKDSLFLAANHQI